MVKLIECPRDAMQGIRDFIPTEVKAEYINKLLRAGFDTIDFGSFVSPKAIPQMADTTEVLKKIDLSSSKTKLLAIIANVRGAQDGAAHEEISYLGYPFSISETFQQRNTNRGIEAAFSDLKEINDICSRSGKELVTYISMGFGNPYGDPWNKDIVEEWVVKLMSEGIRIFSLSDTVGAAKGEDIKTIFSYLQGKYPDIEIGAHFHSRPDMQQEKINSAYESGCRRFDSAMLGFGGCPMAADDLTGNISTEFLLDFLKQKGADNSIDKEAFKVARRAAQELFGKYH